MAVYRNSLWFSGNCSEFVWQLRRTEFIVPWQL